MSSMQSSALDFLLLKVAALTTTVGTVMGGFYLHADNLPFFNVSVYTFGMCAAGSMIAFGYGTPIESRRKLYGYAIGGIFIGIWGMQLILWRGIDIPPEFRPAVGGSLALISRWAFPFIVDNLPLLWNRIFGNGSRGNGEEE